VPFVWNDECEAAFLQARELLISALLLHAKEFFLWMDGSGLGFGAVLDGGWMPSSSGFC